MFRNALKHASMSLDERDVPPTWIPDSWARYDVSITVLLDESLHPHLAISSESVSTVPEPSRPSIASTTAGTAVSLQYLSLFSPLGSWQLIAPWRVQVTSSVVAAPRGGLQSPSSHFTRRFACAILVIPDLSVQVYILCLAAEFIFSYLTVIVAEEPREMSQRSMTSADVSLSRRSLVSSGSEVQQKPVKRKFNQRTKLGDRLRGVNKRKPPLGTSNPN